MLSRLDPDQFDVEALPGWRIREVLAHLITTDRSSVTGGILPTVVSTSDRLERWNDRQVVKLSERTPADLIVALDRWGRRFARFASALPAPMYRLPMPTIWGRGSAGMLLHSRAFDEWVHRQDIRRALGQADEEVDLAPVADFLMTAIRVNTLPSLAGLTGTVGVSLPGVPLPAWRFDLAAGSAQPDGDGAPQPDARVSMPGAAFIMTSAGRGTFDDLEKAGSISIEGDRQLAAAFLGKIRIV